MGSLWSTGRTPSLINRGVLQFVPSKYEPYKVATGVVICGHTAKNPVPSDVTATGADLARSAREDHAAPRWATRWPPWASST